MIQRKKRRKTQILLDTERSFIVNSTVKEKYRYGPIPVKGDK